MEQPTELEIARADVVKELEKWDHLQVDIASINLQGGMVKLSQRIDTLVELLIEKEVIDQDEMELRFSQIALRSLQQLRAEVEPQVQAAKVEQIRRNGGKIILP